MFKRIYYWIWRLNFEGGVKIEISFLKLCTVQEQKKDIAALEARLYVSGTAKDRTSHILWVVFEIATHKFSFPPWQHSGTAIEKTNLLKHFQVCQTNLIF